MNSAGRFTLGVAEENQSGFSAELMVGVEAAAGELGWLTRRVNTGRDEAECDVVLAIGNASLFPDLVRRPKQAARVLWHGETLLRPAAESGGAVHRWLPTGRLLDIFFGAAPFARRAERLVRARERAAMVREPLANLRVLRQTSRAFDRIVIDAHDRAEGAIRAGLAVEVVPYGYHPSFAGPFVAGGERTIDVVLLGHLVGRHGRRQRLLAEVERDLASRGVNIRRITSGTYGRERAAILAQARILIDLHRVPGNHPGFRFIVAAAAGAAVVSEPLHRPDPLVPGMHHVEAPAGELVAVIAQLLDDEPRRQRIVEAAQSLLATELHMGTVLPSVVGGVQA